MMLSDVCWLLTLCFALCFVVSGYDYLQFDCSLPTAKGTFEQVANGEYLEAYVIPENEQKFEASCFRTILSKVDNFAFCRVEYIKNNNQITFNKTLTYRADGTIMEEHDGEYIHLAYPRNRPDLSMESAFLAKYFAENPDDYKTEFNNCKYESMSDLRKKLSTENKDKKEL